VTWLDSVESVAPPTLDTPPELLADTRTGAPPFDPLARRQPIPRGTWTAGVSYEINDLVTDGSSVFRCVLANVADATNDTTHARYWQPWVTASVPGPQVITVSDESGIEAWDRIHSSIQLEGAALTGPRLVTIEFDGAEGRFFVISNFSPHALTVADNFAGNEIVIPASDRRTIFVGTDGPAIFEVSTPLPAGTGVLTVASGVASAKTIGDGIGFSGSTIIGRSSPAVDRSALSPVVWFKGGHYTLSNGQIASLLDLSGNSRHATKQAGAGSRTRALRVVTPSGAPAWTLEVPFVTPSFACPKMLTFHTCVRRKWDTVTAYNAFFGIVNGLTDGAGLSLTGATAQDWTSGDLLVFGNGYQSARAPRAVSSGFPRFADNEWIVISGRIGTSPRILANGYAPTLRASTTSSQAGSNSSGALWIGSNPSTSDQVDTTAAMAELVIISGEQSDANMDALHADLVRELLGSV